MTDRNDGSMYGLIDDIQMPRSIWDRDWTIKTTFNAGVLVPFMTDIDIIPGTTIKQQTSMVVRMMTPYNPVMDNLVIDFYYFKCSKFWYWEHFKAQMGENEQGAWTQTIEYITPQIIVNTQPKIDDIIVYMGAPYKQNKINGTGYNLSMDRCALLAYIDIWNNWFRDQNLQAPIVIDKSDANITYDGTAESGGKLLPVCRTHDYFSSLLPQPQKADAVTMPLGTTANVKISPLRNTNGNLGPQLYMQKIPDDGNTGQYTNAQPGYFMSGSDRKVLSNPPGNDTNYALAWSAPNLGGVADLTTATAATINALRLAFATQRIYEKDAMFGTRYREVLRGQFGVTASDEALLVPEYLGGQRFFVNLETVLQQSSTDTTSPLGETGAFSVTATVNDDFTKSFTKHDILIGVLCVRVAQHSYQQGLARMWTRQRRLDHYWPSLAHIGAQPVYNYEIYNLGEETDNGVFGYKQAWQEYIYKPNIITGQMRSDYEETLDVWHYGDQYSNVPVLSNEWISEPTNNIDRTLIVSSTTGSHQFWADILIKQTVAAPIPRFRVPGLIDHY